MKSWLRLNHGLWKLEGYSSNSHFILYKWYPPIIHSRRRGFLIQGWHYCGKNPASVANYCMICIDMPSTNWWRIFLPQEVAEKFTSFLLVWSLEHPKKRSEWPLSVPNLDGELVHLSTFYLTKVTLAAIRGLRAWMYSPQKISHRFGQSCSLSERGLSWLLPEGFLKWGYPQFSS
jgi:hypothetical protein